MVLHPEDMDYSLPQKHLYYVEMSANGDEIVIGPTRRIVESFYLPVLF